MNVLRNPTFALCRIISILCVATFPLVLFAQPCLANDLDSRLARLDVITRDIRDVSADFQEKVFTAMLKKPLSSQGVVFVKGKRTHWKTIKPTAVSLLTGGDHIAIYYPSRNTVEMYALDQHLRALAISPLPRLAMLRRNFVIEPDVRSSEPTPENVLRLRLVPKNEAVREYIEEIFVRVDESIGMANQVEMIDADGDRTVITFTNIRTNVGLTDAQVELEIPKNVITIYPLGGGAADDSASLKSQP